MTISQHLTVDTVGDPDEVYGEVVAAFEEVALLTLSEAADLDDVLRLVGQRLCELLGVNRCSVYLRRGDGRFQGQVGYCAGRRNIDAGVSRLVAGVDYDLFTAEIVRSCAPVLVQNATKDPRTIQRAMRQWGVRDMLGVPLVVDGDVTGIIYVDNQGEFHDYTTRDVRLAKTFATVSAVAVRQGRLYRQLAERTKIIDQRRRVLGESAVVHDRVTRAVLDGAGIDQILHLIVGLFGKPVVLYGPTLDMVAWSSPSGLGLKNCPAMTRAQIELPWVRRQLAKLDDGRSTVMLRATQDLRCRRLLVCMVVERHCVGYLELCEQGGAFSVADSRALKQAAMAVSFKLLSLQRAAEADRKERGDYLVDILHGRRDFGSLVGRAEAFGFDVMSRHVVLRVQYAVDDSEGTGATGSERRRSVARFVSEVLGDQAHWVAGTGVPDADLMLLEVPATPINATAGSFSALLRLAFPALAQRFGVRFAVVSEPCRSLEDLPMTAEKVGEIGGLLCATGNSAGLVFARDLELVRLISRSDGIQGALRHATEVLGPLQEHDGASGGALLETLRAFVGCQAQIRATAVLLAVHENTVRYRLRRIRAVSAIDPERLDDLVGVSVALQVWSLFGPQLPAIRAAG